MVDTVDLKFTLEISVGSSPTASINFKRHMRDNFYYREESPVFLYIAGLLPERVILGKVKRNNLS